MLSNINRRSFLQAGSAMLAATALPITRGQILRAMPVRRAMLADVVPGLAERRAFAAAALDAAKSAGAAYADVQLRITKRELWAWMGTGMNSLPRHGYEIGAGVRALVNGYWGFSGFDGVPALDDAARMGRDATAQALIGAKGKPRVADLAPAPAVRNQHWTMPIEIDPFTVLDDEKFDVMCALNDDIQRLKYGIGVMSSYEFIRDDRLVASSEGTFCTQTLYTTGGKLALTTEPDYLTERQGRYECELMLPAGMGWEYIRRAPVRDQAPEMIAWAERGRRSKPVDIGRYDVVFDPYAVAKLLDLSIGCATELDRAMGYHANGTGTSYLTAPLEMLGNFKVGSPKITVSADRSMPGGAATAQWDDEGVAPVTSALVTEGTLTDFQTTREAASWLAPYYNSIGQPVRSNGCAGCDIGSDPTRQWPPNFTLHSGVDDIGFDDLVRDTKQGYAVFGGSVSVDYQCLNGSGRGWQTYEIRDGKLTQTVDGISYLFRAPEFWRSVVGIGGKASVRKSGLLRNKRTEWDGSIGTAHTIATVPIKANNVAIIDAARRV